jgi:Lysine methyltransferase
VKLEQLTLSAAVPAFFRQVVWPIAEFMAWLVALSRPLFAGKHVVELGAGCGLTGLVAAHSAAKVVLTDGNDVVLRLLQRNADLFHETASSSDGAQLSLQSGLQALSISADTAAADTANCDTMVACSSSSSAATAAPVQPVVAVAKLMWGEEASLQQYLAEHGAPDVLLGADVVCWPLFITPFLLVSSSCHCFHHILHFRVSLTRSSLEVSIVMCSRMVLSLLLLARSWHVLAADTVGHVYTASTALYYRQPAQCALQYCSAAARTIDIALIVV